MLQLLNQFDLKPNVERTRFDAAWASFVGHLLERDLAVSVGPLYVRRPESGYDTDTSRQHTLMTVISFRDQAQADAAWEAIEGRDEPLGQLHRAVISLVHDPVFTFWAAD